MFRPEQSRKASSRSGVYSMVSTERNRKNADGLRRIFREILQLHPDFTLVADEAALSLVKDLL